MISQQSSLWRLPLSWAISNRKATEIKKISLPLSRAKWIYAAEIAARDNAAPLDLQFINNLPNRAVIRGCNQSLADALCQTGWESLQVGAEAIIDLSKPLLHKRSLRELTRRGLRHGQIKEIELSAAATRQLGKLIAASRHGREPQLQYLFRSGTWPDMRCFVFLKKSGEWLGAITLSRQGVQSLHTEALLKHSDAPIGIMEALICHAADSLHEEGMRYLSLGEVPFVSTGDPVDCKSRHFYRIGHALKFAYNYRGLYQFKQKFAPEWRPIYLCARPGVSWLMLADLFVSSRYILLAGYRLAALGAER